jgi:hypothetical protein
MNKTISIINAGNVYAQTFLKSVSGYSKIMLGDCVNGRRSVYFINFSFTGQSIKLSSRTLVSR